MSKSAPYSVRHVEFILLFNGEDNREKEIETFCPIKSNLVFS